MSDLLGRWNGAGLDNHSAPSYRDERRQISICFDGRIHNRRDLIARYGLKNPADPEIVAFIWRERQGALQDLTGDFAFALYDSREERLCLVRDALGVRPLYYFREKNAVLFSSRIEPLFGFPSVPREPDLSTVAGFLMDEFHDADRTFFRGIRQVPPGTALIFSKNREPEFKKFWPRGIKAVSFVNKEDCYAGYREIFMEAVRCRLPETGPAGILLSGGIDSTQVCAAAETMMNGRGPLKASSLILDGFPEEEWEALDGLEHRFGTEIEWLRFLAKEMGQTQFEMSVRPGETPHPNGFMTMPMLVRPLVEKKCSVIFTGFGASELFNGAEWGHLKRTFFEKGFSGLRREASRIAGATDDSASSVAAFILRDLLVEMIPHSGRRAIRAWRNAARKWPSEALKRYLPSAPPRTGGSGRGLAAVTQPSFVFAVNQMDYFARESGAELAHPFLDVRLVEYFLGLPPEIQFGDGYRKMFAQNALEPVAGPARPVESAKCRTPELSNAEMKRLETGRLKVYLSNDGAMIYRYVEKAAVENMFARIEACDSNDWRLSLSFLWRLAMLENWLQEYFQNSRSTEEVRHERPFSSIPG